MLPIAKPNSLSSYAEVAAFIGAATYCVALIWNFLKWFKDERVSLSVKIFDEVTHTSEDGDRTFRLCAEIHNIGKIPTTIKSVHLEIYPTKFAYLRRKRVGFPMEFKFVNWQLSLPKRLDQGDGLFVMLPLSQESISHIPSMGEPHVMIDVSHWKRPRGKRYRFKSHEQSTNTIDKY